MRLFKARVQGYRSVIDTGFFEIENDKTILVGPNEAGKTAILQALSKLNPPKGTDLFDPLRDYPRALYDEDIEKGGIDPSRFTVVEGYFSLEEDDKAGLPEAYKEITYVYGRKLNNDTWQRIDGGPATLKLSDLQIGLARLLQHFQSFCISAGNTQDVAATIQTELDGILAGMEKNDFVSDDKASVITKWIDKNLVYLDDGDEGIKAQYEKITDLLERPIERSRVQIICQDRLPVFILFGNYFRIKPVLHLRKLSDRIKNNSLDDKQYDYGNICLLKFLGFTAEELANAGDVSRFDLSRPEQFENFRAQLDERDYRLNAATIRLTNAIRDVWNTKEGGAEANKLRIKADGQYLKVVVEDELGVEVELDQRSEGFQWLVSFYVVFFSEASDKHKNSILLLDEPGQSLHALKQAEFRHTLSKLSEKNQTIYTTHSPFLVGTNELDKVRVVEMLDRRVGTKVNTSLSASDSGAMLPLQEALGYDLAQSLFFHKKNLVLEGLTDMWYLESLSELLRAEGKPGIDEKIALIPANCASKVVYFATILHAQNLKIAALLDSDAEGDVAASQDTLVNALGTKRIIRTKDVYQGTVAKTEIEDILRDTLVVVAKEQLGWDSTEVVNVQISRPIVDILTEVADGKFSKFQLAKAFVRWSRDHSLKDLTPVEVEQAEKLIIKINKALA